MAGITASIAQQLHDSSVTLIECAELLGITCGQLDERLLLLERQVYVNRINNIVKDEGCICGHSYASCCRNHGSQAPAIFTLTQKGEHLVQAWF